MRRVDKLAAAFGHLGGEKLTQRPAAAADAARSVKQRGANALALQFVGASKTGQPRADNPNADLRRHWRCGKNLIERAKHTGDRASTGQLASIGEKLPARQLALEL